AHDAERQGEAARHQGVHASGQKAEDDRLDDEVQATASADPSSHQPPQGGFGTTGACSATAGGYTGRSFPPIHSVSMVEPFGAPYLSHDRFPSTVGQVPEWSVFVIVALSILPVFFATSETTSPTASASAEPE